MMNVSSVLGLHGWLHIIMFAVIAILIKRCAEMQQLPGYHGNQPDNRMPTSSIHDMTTNMANMAETMTTNMANIASSNMVTDMASETMATMNMASNMASKIASHQNNPNIKDTNSEDKNEQFGERLEENKEPSYCSTDIYRDSIQGHTTNNHDLYTQSDYGG